MNKLSKIGSDAEVLRAVIDQHRDGFIVVDTDLKVIFANTPAYTLFNIDPDQDPAPETGKLTIEQKFEQIIIGFRDLVQKAEQEKHGVTDVRRIKIVNDVKYIEAYVNTIQLANNAQISTLTCRDTSEEVNWRHMMRTSLQQNTEMVRAIAETVPVAVSVTDSKGRFVAINNKLCDLVGYKPQDLINQTFTIILPEENRESASKSYQWFLAGAGQAPEAEELLTKQGARLTADVTATTFMGRNGRPYKVTCYAPPAGHKSASGTDTSEVV